MSIKKTSEPVNSPSLLDNAPAPMGWVAAKAYLQSLTPDRAATVWQALTVELMEDLEWHDGRPSPDGDYSIKALCLYLRTVHVKLLQATTPTRPESLKDINTFKHRTKPDVVPRKPKGGKRR